MPYAEIILGTLAFLANTYLALIIILRNPKSWTNRLFFLLALQINGYIVVNYLSLHPPLPTPENQLFWIRMVMAELGFMGPTLFLLVHTFPREKIRLHKFIIFLLMNLGILTTVFAYFPFVFTSIEYPNGQPVPQPGPAMPLFFFDFVGLFFISMIMLVYKYVKSTGVEKVQHFYFLIGTVLTFTLMAVTTVIFVVILKFSGLVFLGPLVIVFLLTSIAYSIIKHQFLDIRLVVMRSVSYVLSVLLLGALFSSALFFIQSIVFGYDFGRVQFFVSIGLALFIMFTFQPVKNWFEQQTAGLFFRNTLDPQSFLEEIGRDIASHLEFSSLVNVVLQRIQDQLKASNMRLITLDTSWKGLFKKVKFVIENPRDIEELVKLVKEIFANGPRRVVFEEIDDESVKSVMRKHQIGIILPLMVNYQVIGGLIVGQKQSGGMFSTTDLEVLEILTPQLATGVQNALSYEKIRRFNETLKDEVDQATSELRESHKKLQQSYKKLKELDQLKDEFVSIASHELRTPLTAIRGYIWMVLHKSGKKLPEKVKKDLTVALDSSDHLAKLVEDMLTISRIEGKRLILEKSDIDVIALVQKVYEELKIKADEKHIQFTVQSEEQFLTIHADNEKIRESVINLVGNALKFTPDEGSICISILKKAKSVAIQVSDTGPGISKEDQKRLFQKFSRLDHSYQKTSETGTGLGLYITQQIVHLHEGKISVYSELGKGTTFEIELPV